VGVLGRFEKGIERAVNGAFARAFRSEVQPVELASAIKREADENASVVGRNRTIAPNDYVIELGPADHRRLAQWEDALGDELSTVLNDHALQQRYAFVGPVRVRFERSEELDTGLFRVRSRTVRPEHGGDGFPAGRGAGQEQPYPGGHGQAAQQADSWAPADPYAAAGYPAAAQVPPGHPASAAPYAPPYAAPAHAPEHPAADYPPGYSPDYPAPAPYASPYAYPGPVDRPVPTLELDGRRIPLTRAVTVLGRAADVDVPLDDAGVSRRHAEVHVTDGRYRVVDLGSTNGTFVDGERVTTGELRDGSTITVGRSRLVFRLGQR
jgi:hypothetical protein